MTNNKFAIKRWLLLLTGLYTITCHFVQGQSWSMEYHLEGDSSVYLLSPDKVIKGKPIDFFFPAYKYCQTSLQSAVESVNLENNLMIELKLENYNFSNEEVDIEIDLYAENIDTVQIYYKTTDEKLQLLKQEKPRKGFKFLPTFYTSIDVSKNDVKSFLIIGKSKVNDSRLILGRFSCLLGRPMITEDVAIVDSFVTKYANEKESDVCVNLTEMYMMLFTSKWSTRLVLKDCFSVYDSIQCISQFIEKKLIEYNIYDIYGINKDKLIASHAILVKNSNDVDSYYRKLHEILASLNNCHVRLSVSKYDDIDSPLQPIYFYNIKNAIEVTAVFDPTLVSSIQLGDELLSINRIPLSQIYQEYSKSVYASTDHQNEMKITQKLLYLAKEKWGDSLVLELRGDTSIYSVLLNRANFTNKKVVPDGFKLVVIIC